MSILRPSLVLAAFIAPLATGAAAQQSFVSPMGEPFHARQRGGDALADWFHQADTNHDGALTVAELTADADRFFATLDTDHDGEIGPDEIQHYEEVIAIDNGYSEASSGRYGLLRNPEPVLSADSDFNRGVSAAEFRKAASKRFALLDVNHTGRLTLPELEGLHGAAAAASKRPERVKEQQVGIDMPSPQ